MSDALYSWLRRQAWLYDVEHDSMRPEYRVIAHAVMGAMMRVRAFRYRFHRPWIGRPGALRLNIGCGRTPLEGWVNLDINPFSGADILLDVGHSWPFRESEVDTVYMRHFLEHFNEREVGGILRKCFVILKPGGGLRIGVPSLKFAIQEYQNSDFSRYSWVTAYGRKSVGRRFVSYILDNGNHKIMFDYGYLAELLEQFGFREISQSCGGRSVVVDPGLLGAKDHSDDRETLYVECRK